MTRKIQILAFAGSLRAGSFNKALVQAAIQVAPPSVSIEVFNLEGIPPFNADLETIPPTRVVKFKDKIRDADALLIATPEYNYSVSSVLKNAIDWASRPKADNPLEGKPVAIMSASTSKFGGARAQYHLRQIFVFLNMQPINKPEVMLSDAAHNVDVVGKLTNQETLKLIKQLVEAVAAWTIKLQNKPE